MTNLTRAEFLRGAWGGHPVAPSLDALAFINDRCLAHEGVVCRTCGESCDADAICFEPIAGSAPQPQIDADRCIGCGDCLASCPTQSIFLSQRDPEGD